MTDALRSVLGALASRWGRLPVVPARVVEASFRCGTAPFVVLEPGRRLRPGGEEA